MYNQNGQDFEVHLPKYTILYEVHGEKNESCYGNVDSHEKEKERRLIGTMNYRRNL